MFRRKGVRSGGWAEEVESLLCVTQGIVIVLGMFGRKQGESKSRTKALLMEEVISIVLRLLPRPGLCGGR